MGDKSLGPNRVYIQNKKTNDKITVFTKDTTRYIIDGYHHFVPDTNYVKVIISDDYNFGEHLTICWGLDGKTWKAIHTDRILENKLAPDWFEYNISLKEALGQSTQIESLPNTCSLIYLNYNLFVHLGIDDGYSVSGLPEIKISREWF